MKYLIVILFGITVQLFCIVWALYNIEKAVHDVAEAIREEAVEVAESFERNSCYRHSAVACDECPECSGLANDIAQAIKEMRHE